ncbi:MAG: GNAT family N-acetyltransferase [Rhodobacterales bacterium]|nr:GNAT family N-acetyltransferase [Rhodobacterales bacterium]
MNTDPFEEIVIADACSAAFDQFFAIYEEALPAGERKPREAIVALSKRSDSAILGLSCDGQVVAFAIVFASNTAPVGLLEYMATSKALRNAGLGKRLFAMALARMEGRVMLVEVESEREKTADTPLRLRRKNFYCRLGCQQVEKLDYIMPMVSAEKPPVLDLLFHTGGQAITVTDTLLRTWLETVYTEVYGRRINDSNIALMLQRRAEEMRQSGEAKGKG